MGGLWVKSGIVDADAGVSLVKLYVLKCCHTLQVHHWGNKITRNALDKIE